MNELTCSAVLAHLCRGPLGGTKLRCGQPATVAYVHQHRGRVGRCAAHDVIDLTMPENKGWTRQPIVAPAMEAKTP